MQTLDWYYWRLKAMGPAELAWRVTSMARDLFDRVRLGSGWRPAASRAEFPPGPPPFRVSDMEVGAWRDASPGSIEHRWRERLVRQADHIVAHRLSYFDLEHRHHGDPFDWHRDHSAGVAAPRSYSMSIDYRDFGITGDCKLVWEPNRHHHFVVLARAWRVTGEIRYATALAQQFESWLDANPFMTGMNWRSGLELGVRLINWVWAIDLVSESGAISPPLRRRIEEAVYLHCWDNQRKYSQGSSSNNHLVGEAAGVFVACCYFSSMPSAAEWRADAGRILQREALRQSHADGGTREQAIGYQMFVLEFYLCCGLAARWIGAEFPGEFWARVEKMIEFLVWHAEGGDSLSFFGDADDGYVLDLGREPRSPSYLASIAVVLFGRGDFKRWVGELKEPARWLLGRGAQGTFESMAMPQDAPLPSRAFRDSGWYLLQGGRVADGSAISVVVDCAELGLGSIAAHGHADALSIAVRAYGTDVLVDPGTYDYYSHPEWRNHFRSTRAHNTVEVDGLDQSTRLGNFMWGQRAVATCRAWSATESGHCFEGQHDGYQRLPNPVVHRRRVELHDVRREIAVTDELQGAGSHEVAICFQMSEHCTDVLIEGHACHFKVAGRHATINFDPDLRPEVQTGNVTPIAGWVSRGYHLRQAAPVLVLRGSVSGTRHFDTVICLPLE